jgi:hypothetical protein
MLGHHADDPRVSLRLTLRQQTEVRDLGGGETASRSHSGMPQHTLHRRYRLPHRRHGRHPAWVPEWRVHPEQCPSAPRCTAGLDDPIESAAIDHEILDHREGPALAKVRHRLRRHL